VFGKSRSPAKAVVRGEKDRAAGSVSENRQKVKQNLTNSRVQLQTE